MKKSLLSFFALAIVALGFCGPASALNLDQLFQGEPSVTDYQRILQEYDNTWGYLNEQPTATVNESEIIIETNTVDDRSFSAAPIYRLFFSPYRVSALRDGNNLDATQIMMREFNLKDGSEIKFVLSALEGVDPNQVYYGFIAPLDSYDDFGTPSDEICFVLNNSEVQFGEDACNALELLMTPAVEDLSGYTEDENILEGLIEDVEEHGSAECVGMDLANISHTVSSDNVITLSWTSVGDAETNVEIAVFNPEDEAWQKIADVKMGAEKYSYKMKWNGEQMFMLTNGCGKEVVYKADAAIKTDTPEPIVPAATGPAENIFMILIAAIVLYGAYAVFFRKAE